MSFLLDAAALDGAIGLCATAEGRCATAVLVVLLTWAVLAGRVYVLAPPRSVINREPASPTHDDDDWVAPKTMSRRRTASVPSVEETGIADENDGGWNPSQLPSLAGKAVRCPRTKRLLLRDGAYWCGSPEASAFVVRGPNYLVDRVKIKCNEPLFHLLDCDLFDVDQPENHMGRHLGARMEQLWRESGLLEPDKKPFTWLIQLQVPGPPYKSFCMYFGCADRSKIFDEDTPIARLARRFFQRVTSPRTAGVNAGKGTFASNDQLHEWRNNTFKLIPRCVNAPFVVKKAVGEVPTLLGNKIELLYYGPESGDYFETDCNIASSKIAQYTIGLAIGRASVVVADMAFLLQGAAPAELPEELFGCVRIEHIVMKDAHKLDLSGAAAPP